MAQTYIGAIKTAAKKAGTSFEEYSRRIADDLKWCTLCKAWHASSDFGKDKSRSDGLAASCLLSRQKEQRQTYIPHKRLANGRSFVPARNGDKKQARRRINYFVEAGLLPKPNSVPCVDCGHVWTLGERRHEYDHHLGYAAEHHEHVEALCSRCHHARERKRNG